MSAASTDRVPAHRRAVIAGIGHTEFSQSSGRSTLQLAAATVRTLGDLTIVGIAASILRMP